PQDFVVRRIGFSTVRNHERAQFRRGPTNGGAARIEVCIWIGAMGEEQLYEFAVVYRRRRSERGASRRTRLRQIRISAAVEQQANDRVAAELRGAAQWTPSAGANRMNKARIPVQKFPHTIEISEGAGNGQIVGRAAIQKQSRGF